MNHFEVYLMASSRVVYHSKVLRMAVSLRFFLFFVFVFPDKKGKTAIVMFEILDGFSLVRFLMYILHLRFLATNRKQTFFFLALYVNIFKITF